MSTEQTYRKEFATWLNEQLRLRGWTQGKLISQSGRKVQQTIDNLAHALRGLTGMVKVKKSVERLLNSWDNGVKDKFENQKLFSVPFTPKDIISFAYSHQPFAPGPTLYHALVHEFGRAIVEDAFDQLAPSFVDQG